MTSVFAKCSLWLSVGGYGLQVSTPGLQEAAKYLEKECRDLAELANARSDLIAQVDVEMVSGAVVDVIFGVDLINVYRHLTNIILFIAPKDAAEKPAVMINAHYDSALGSPGAADCGSCVGVGLEVIRTMIASGQPLHHPLLLLLNGGEETLLQAAHGFIKQSRWNHRIGAFVNIESTGSDGVPILFQYAGTWTLNAYAQGVSSPRALVLAQEFFESGLLPADTDFRIFARHEELKYPGIDMATILDATSYHTNRDTFDRLRSGSTQEYGLAVMEAVKQMMEMLDDDTGDIANEKVVYGDILHQFMLVYSIRTARWLHALPFGFVTLSMLASQKTEFVRAGVFGVVQYGVCLLLSLITPAMFGMLRVLLSGRPMVWFSHHAAAFLFYIPSSFLGFLLPLTPAQSKDAISGRYASIAAAFGLLALILTFNNIGSSIFPFVLSLTTAMAASIVALSRKPPFKLLLILAFSSALYTGTNLTMLSIHVMQKGSMAGRGHPKMGAYLLDGVVGAVHGIVAVSVLLSFAPLVPLHWRPFTKSRWLKLLGCWCLLAGIISSCLFPYSQRHPKRIFFNLVCRQNVNGSCNPVWTVSTWDPIPVEEALPESLKKLSSLENDPLDWLCLSPFESHIGKATFFAESFPQVGSWGQRHPRLEIVNRMEKGGNKRVELELRWEKPGWGAMKIEGEIINWSLSEPSGIKGSPSKIRFAQDRVDPIWPFWIEYRGNLTLQLGIYYHIPTPEAQHISTQFPEWTATSTGSSFVSEHNFS